MAEHELTVSRWFGFNDFLFFEVPLDVVVLVIAVLLRSLTHLLDALRPLMLEENVTLCVGPLLFVPLLYNGHRPFILSLLLVSCFLDLLREF